MDSQRIVSGITNVKDSKGETVNNGGSTDDPLLTLSGGGTANSVVFVYDNGALLTPASVTINRTWEFTDTIELGRHAFTVRDELAGVDSPEWVVTVGASELDLDKPTVAQAPGGTLNPIDAISGATVVVTYDMLPTDTVGLSWNGLDNLVPSQPGSALGSVTFTIPASAVAAVIGKTIPVLYAVVRNGVAKLSEVLDLTVQTLADSVLEAPKILQAVDGRDLDVVALTSDADLRVRPWPLIAAGQRISLRFEGTKADSAAYNWPHPTWQNLPLTSAGEPSTTVALAALKELKDGSSLTLVFEVSFDGGGTTVAFPVRTYVVKALEIVTPVITAVKDAEGVEIPEDQTTLSTSVTITGTATAGQQVQIFDDTISLGTVTATGGSWTLALSLLTPKTYNIMAQGLYGSNPVSQRRTFSVVALGREDFEGYQGPVELPAGVNVNFANGLVGFITSTPGVMKATIHKVSYPGATWGLKSLAVFPDNNPRFEFGRLIRSFKFTYKCYVPNDSVVFYAADDTEIQSYPLSQVVTTVEITLLRPCAYCKFRLYRDAIGAQLSCVLDNFEWF
jgi:hypothetical protein